MVLRIVRLAPDGSGVAEDGAQVQFTLPGDVVVRGADGAFALMQPSPDRVAPPCPHFGTCGGCAMQHVEGAALGRWKREGVVRQLGGRGIAAAPALVPAAPPGSRRRAFFAGRRTKRTVTVGFHARRSDAIVAVTQCPLVRAEILAAKPALVALTLAGATRSKPLRLGVTHGPAGLDVDVREGRDLDERLQAGLAAIANAHDLARLSWAGETVALRRPPWQEVGAARVVPPPGAFLQPTAEGEAALAAAVMAAVGAAGPVVDLFAGCGTFALRLAARAEVHAVEGAGAMLAALDAGWRRAPGLRRVTVETRDLFRRPLLPHELDRFGAVVIDPPRAGAEAQTRAIAASNVGLVAAVSCHPGTFARDAAILLDAGFRLEWLRLVDQFRWSAHVELVARFKRGAQPS